ncbi:MAG: ATP-binding cassette domain-containing protein [Gemmatimonadetes bacterium]|nr:ATP-binding cassette domain-containing protein [Gemmatimonadota bacterium]MBT8402745.1 ATP-binding cassette domain-containing protein [Gemmatimonadota bacterium]NNF38018.1 ATP-binding cassette domain-containing protein [Gemmatimonadota bacterium]
MTVDSPAVRLQGVTKTFGRHRAVDHLDLTIPRGSLYGLLGPNGSGKTTTIRMIMGILHPDEGSVALLGAADLDETRRQRVGYLPEERGVYRKMRVLDFLVFLGEIRGLARVEGRRRASDWLDRLGLEEWADKRTEDLSKGMQQKVQFVATVLHEPEFLILDEPFSGLDPINQDVLEDIVRDFHRRGRTILFSTHLMHQAERLCQRVCLISRARKVLDGDLRELKRSEGDGAVEVEFEGPSGWWDGPEVSGVDLAADHVRIALADGADPQAVLRRGLAAGAVIRRFEIAEPSLHEIFVRHAGGEGAVDAGVPRELALDGVAGGAA